MEKGLWKVESINRHRRPYEDYITVAVVGLGNVRKDFRISGEQATLLKKGDCVSGEW